MMASAEHADPICSVEARSREAVDASRTANRDQRGLSWHVEVTASADAEK
jgi:hypothetical protein